MFDCSLKIQQLVFHRVGVDLREIHFNFSTIGSLIVGGCFPIIKLFYFNFTPDDILTLGFEIFWSKMQYDENGQSR